LASPGAEPSTGLEPPDGNPAPSSVAPSLDPGATPTPPPGGIAGALDAGLARRLESILRGSANGHHVTGLSAAIRLADGRSWTLTLGNRTLVPAPVPVDRDTVFSIASITKTFITASVMQLVADGKLSLADRLSRWMPAFPNARAITVRELLGHTGGVFNYFENPRYNGLVFSNPSHRWTFAEIMALATARPGYCDPGTCYHYSNTDYVILGHIVELVTGRTIGQVVRTRLLDPLGLQHTFFQPYDSTPANAAHAFLFADGRQVDYTRRSEVIPTLSAATVASSAGAMVASASDLARWAQALYGGTVVAPGLLTQMEASRACYDWYGLGTRTRFFNGRRAYGHLGSLRGFTDAMWYFPREGAAIVILTNEGSWVPDNTVRKLSTVLFAGIGAPAPEFAPTFNSKPVVGTLHC